MKPGDATNVIDPRGSGTLRVAIPHMGFSLGALDRRSLAFGPAGAPPSSGPAVRDVDHDGTADLVVSFRLRHTGLGLGDSEACVRGRFLDGTRFEGCDVIHTPPSR